MQQNRLGTALDNLVDMLIFEHRLTVYNDVITLDGNHLARILVHEIFDPSREHTGSQLTAYSLFSD